MIDPGSRAMHAPESTLGSQPYVSAGSGVGGQFEALLMASVLKPLATALGFYGDAVVSSAARAMFRGTCDPLAERLDALGEPTASLPVRTTMPSRGERS